MSGAVRLRSVLNGLLEDRLLDDPNMLHFALEPGARAGVPVWVAACNRIWLRSAVQALEAAGRRVTRIVPEFAPQPAGAPPMVFAIGEPGAAQLVLCDADGVTALPLDPAGVALAGPLPEGTAMLAEPAVAELAESLLGRRVPIVKPAERWLQASRSPWDLAQFDLASTGRARASKKLAAHRRAPLWHAPAMARRALGRAGAGAGPAHRPQCLGLEGAQRARRQARRGEQHPDPDLPFGAAGGRCAGADGARGRRAAAGHRRRRRRRPRTHARRAGHQPAAGPRAHRHRLQRRPAAPARAGPAGRRSSARSPPRCPRAATAPAAKATCCWCRRRRRDEMARITRGALAGLVARAASRASSA